MYKRFPASSYMEYVILFIFIILIFSIFKLQIIEGEKYKNIAEKNIVRIQTIYPTRGEIYDRKYRPIVLNKPSYNLYIIPGKIIGKESVSEFVSDYFDKEIDEIMKIIHENRYRSYQEILLIQDITFEKMTIISEQLNYYPSLLFKAEKVRKYFYANHFTGYTGRITEDSLLFKAEKVRKYFYANHFTGYTGRITEDEYEKL